MHVLKAIYIVLASLFSKDFRDLMSEGDGRQVDDIESVSF
jgi:hypothetical protein